ncbi:SDR family NAD(P)-dependent oxidoreductase [Lactococcus lactis]|uniref:SDR family NAD(P)-dependent oxidoreductase n=1 Tax=Lactococcus lactis TaxID=1358 RepID=UPI00223B9C36|nr:SDR family NAD(P)-dependent oxidoreductase [Lactococcus lactis]
MNKRTILITGATRGIGWAIAQKAAQANHKVILTGRDPLSLKSRAEELKKKISQNRNPSYYTRCF